MSDMAPVLHLPEVSWHARNYPGRPEICPLQERMWGSSAGSQESQPPYKARTTEAHAQVHTPLIHMDGTRKDNTDKYLDCDCTFLLSICSRLLACEAVLCVSLLSISAEAASCFLSASSFPR